MQNTIRITMLCCSLLPGAAARGEVTVYDSSTGADRFASGNLVEYTIVAIPTFGGSFHMPKGINNLGQVTGRSDVPSGTSYAYIWDSNTDEMTQISSPYDWGTYGEAINDAGDIAGWFFFPPPPPSPLRYHGFVYRNGVFTDLTPSGPASGVQGWAINDTDMVAGFVGSYATVWEGGVETTLTAVTTARDVNNAGLIVGHAGAFGNINGGAIIWHADGDPNTNDARDLGGLPGGGVNSLAYCINDANQVAGYADIGGGHHAVLWENLSWDASDNYTGDIIDLGVLPGGVSSAGLAINSAGTVVGVDEPSIGLRAIIWDSTRGLRDLNDLIPPDSGWTLYSAVGINDSGQIIGLGTLGDFLLTPVPVCGDGVCEGDEPLTCPQDCSPIPTVSQWGMAAMTCLVLAAGTILFRRRGTAARHVGT